MARYLKCLSDIKKNLHKHCSSIENIVDEISYSLNPIQIGKFLLTLEKERNRKDFSVEKLWFGYQIEQVFSIIFPQIIIKLKFPWEIFIISLNFSKKTRIFAGG